MIAETGEAFAVLGDKACGDADARRLLAETGVEMSCIAVAGPAAAAGDPSAMADGKTNKVPSTTLRYHDQQSYTLPTVERSLFVFQRLENSLKS